MDTSTDAGASTAMRLISNLDPSSPIQETKRTRTNNGEMELVTVVCDEPLLPEEPSIPTPQLWDEMRLVASEFHAGQVRTDTSAGTPPLLAPRMFLSIVSSSCQNGQNLLMLVANAEVPFLQADEPGKVYMQPPPSVWALDCCWKLLKSMCGTRCASRNWQKQISTVTGSRDYLRLQSCANIRTHDEFQIYVLVHRDDFYIISDQKRDQQHERALWRCSSIEIHSTAWLERCCVQEARTLNRCTRVTSPA